MPNRHVVRHHPYRRPIAGIAALRAAHTVGRAVGQAVKNATKAARATTQEAAPKGTVTAHHDLSRVFKKRKISKSKIRKIKFAKRVQQAQSSDQPFSTFSQTCDQVVTFVKNTNVQSSEQWASTNPGNQNSFMINYGANLYPSGDLPRMMDYWRDPLLFTPVGAGGGAIGAPSQAHPQNFKLHLGHHRFNINVTNVAPAALTYDIYQFVAAQDISDGNYQSPAQAWSYLMAQEDTVRDGLKPVPESNGLTPLDVPEFGRYWRLLKKDRVLLSANGGTTDIQMTGLHPRVVERGRLIENFAVKGLTQAFLVIGGIGDTEGLPNGATPGTPYVITRISWNKVWHFTTDGDGANGPGRPFHYHKIGA